MKNRAVTRGINYPVYTNYFIAGTTAVIDRAGDTEWLYLDITLSRAVLTYLSVGNVSKSTYLRLSGVSTISLRSEAIIKVTASHTQAAIGPWTSAEAKHAGLFTYYTDPDNNYGLMISPAASTAGERSIQLIKQVVGVESILATSVVAGISLNTEYRLTLERVAGVLTGNVYDMAGTLVGTVSASDSSLSSGNTGVHGYSVTYTARGINAL